MINAEQLAGASVVVGTDGSRCATTAVRLAAGEAARRHRDLLIIHAIVPPYLPQGSEQIATLDSQLRAAAEAVVADAAAAARADHPELAIRTHLQVDAPSAALVAASHHATLIVVGSRGHSRLAELLLGSTAYQVAGHAHCPAIIARDTQEADGPVVIGIDGAPESAAAVGFAFEEAALRDAALVAVHTWRYPVARGPADIAPLTFDAETFRDDEQRLLAEALAGWRDKYPDVYVSERLQEGTARQALVDAAVDAQLLVVGARRRGHWTSLPLGSVSSAMGHHAPCPVAIVPPVAESA
jgi:nucleotide-binding universal stress UspA family protein